MVSLLVVMAMVMKAYVRVVERGDRPTRGSER